MYASILDEILRRNFIREKLELTLTLEYSQLQESENLKLKFTYLTRAVIFILKPGKLSKQTIRLSKIPILNSNLTHTAPRDCNLPPA